MGWRLETHFLLIPFTGTIPFKSIVLFLGVGQCESAVNAKNFYGLKI